MERITPYERFIHTAIRAQKGQMKKAGYEPKFGLKKEMVKRFKKAGYHVKRIRNSYSVAGFGGSARLSPLYEITYPEKSKRVR
jgi:hypothetical protein